MSAIGTKRTSLVALHMSAFGPKADIAPVLCSEDWIDHPPDSVSRCRELIAVAVSQIDGDPIVGDSLVDPALEITVAHFKKIIALQRAGRRNPMTHGKRGAILTANVLVGRSVRHRSTIGLARHRSYGRAATVDKIEQPMGNRAFCRMSAFEGKADMAIALRNVCLRPKADICPAQTVFTSPQGCPATICSYAPRHGNRSNQALDLEILRARYALYERTGRILKALAPVCAALLSVGAVVALIKIFERDVVFGTIFVTVVLVCALDFLADFFFRQIPPYSLDRHRIDVCNYLQQPLVI